MKQKVANAARVDESLVTISVAAASVSIAATIAVPASMTADEMQSSLASHFDTADAASTALGITVVSKPSIAIIVAEPPLEPVTIVAEPPLEPVIIVAKSPVEPDPSSDDDVPATIIVPVVIVVIGACALGSAWLARIMVRRRKQQPLGTATRMKTPNAEADFEMHMTDKGDFNLGSGRPAEDQYGSYRAPSL